MPLGKDGYIQLFQVVDTDGNPARVSSIAGVYRLAVDALLVGPAGAYAQGDFDSTPVDETNALAMWVRAAVTGRNQSLAATAQNVPVEARLASGINGLSTATPNILFTAAVASGIDTTAANVLRPVEVRAMSGYEGRATSLIGQLAGSYLLARRASTLTTMEPVGCDFVNAINGTLTAGGASALYTAAVVTGINTGTAAMSSIEGLGAVAAQSYSRNRLFTDAVLRVNDGATYTAGSGRVADTNIDESLIYVLTRAAVSGLDTSFVATARVRPIASREAVTAQAYAITRLLTDTVLRGDDGATYSAVVARNVDAVGDVERTLIGLLTNSRGALWRTVNANWEFVSGDTPDQINGEASSGITNGIYLRAASALFGRDTSDSTMRAIEARAAVTAQATTLYRLLTDTITRVYESAAGTYSILYGDTPAANGRNTSIVGAWSNSIDTKLDVGGSLLVPTAMERTAQGSAVNPAGAVLATLDARGLTNKSYAVTDTAVSTYDLEVSYDGVTYRVVGAAIATVIGTVYPTALQMEILRAFRYFRIKGNGAASTQTAELSAMGA